MSQQDNASSGPKDEKPASRRKAPRGKASRKRPRRRGPRPAGGGDASRSADAPPAPSYGTTPRSDPGESGTEHGGASASKSGGASGGQAARKAGGQAARKSGGQAARKSDGNEAKDGAARKGGRKGGRKGKAAGKARGPRRNAGEAASTGGAASKRSRKGARPAGERPVRDAPDAPADRKPAPSKPRSAASSSLSGGLAGPVLGGPKKKKGGRPGRKRKSTPTVEGPRETFRGLTLNDFQMQALGPLREGRPVLLAAPTGAGKTLVAELAIQMSLDKGKRAIYTAPIKALSNQKYRDFKAIDADGVGIMTGDVTINPSAPVLIMTTEILRNTILENPDSLSDVETVVFDEIHYMDDPERGTVWEESIIFAPPHVRFVCLSATIANLDQFGDWISKTREQDVEVIRHVERPVPLEHYVWFPAGGLRKVKAPVRFPKEHVAAMRSKGGGRGRGRGDRGHGGKPVDKNVIVDLIRRREELPMLFFCFSRKECERRALDTARKWTLLEPDQTETIEALFDETCTTFEIEPSAELEELRSLVRRGIAYHHAGMLPLHKELVERLFTSALLQVLFCTETFSLGINMPAHTVVFSSLRKFDGTGFGPLKVREYQQMAGRAGRQGIDEQGVVVSLIDDHRVVPADIERLVGNDVEPVVSRFNLSYSTLINLHRSLGERLHEAWENSFNNFQWSRMSAKKRAKNEAKQREAIDRRLELLEEREYITLDGGVTEKGRIAATINGYELQVVELVDSGLLDWMDEIQIAITFAAIGFEERKNDLFRRMPAKVMGTHRKDVDHIIGQLIEHERRLGISAHVKPPSFKIGLVVRAWCLGASFEEIREDTTAPFGDLVRQMRLTVQLLRQLRAALPKNSKLVKTLDRARMLLNRDEVDAARQLGLG